MTPDAVFIWALVCVAIAVAFVAGYLRGENRAWKRHHAELQRRAVRVISNASIHERLGARAELLREKAWWN